MFADLFRHLYQHMKSLHFSLNAVLMDSRMEEKVYVSEKSLCDVIVFSVKVDRSAIVFHTSLVFPVRRHLVMMFYSTHPRAPATCTLPNTIQTRFPNHSSPSLDKSTAIREHHGVSHRNRATLWLEATK